MRKITFVFAAMLLFTAFAYGQKPAPKELPNFAGNWTLDVANSDMGQRGGAIKSMTMVVTQTAEQIGYERSAVIGERPEGGGGGRGAGGRPGGGMGGGGGALGGSPSATFNLDGKETKVEATGGIAGDSKLKAKTENGKLSLKTTRELNTQMGSFTLTTTEKWELSEDGKTLTIKSETITPRGNQTTKMTFTKNEE